HPCLVAGDLIGMQAHAPAVLRLLDPAAEGLGHDLMAEADADQPRLAPRVAQPLRQRLDPRQVFIDARRRAGDDDSGEGRRVIRQFARLNVKAARGHPVAQQGAELIDIVAVSGGQIRWRSPGLKNGDDVHARFSLPQTHDEGGVSPWIGVEDQPRQWDEPS
uniref:DUF5641 domain-containing protein n=1 Tax=Parastrongyloides trichosuri TaxID=131310 RepID=A0A0N5A5R1_PARTI